MVHESSAAESQKWQAVLPAGSPGLFGCKFIIFQCTRVFIFCTADSVKKLNDVQLLKWIAINYNLLSEDKDNN